MTNFTEFFVTADVLMYSKSGPLYQLQSCYDVNSVKCCRFGSFEIKVAKLYPRLVAQWDVFHGMMSDVVNGC